MVWTSKPDSIGIFYQPNHRTIPRTSKATTEGEAFAVAWLLENARMFVLRCQNLIITTDHKPFLGISDNRETSNIPNPCICWLREKTLRYTFTTTYCLDSTISTRQNASDIDIAYAESYTKKPPHIYKP